MKDYKLNMVGTESIACQQAIGTESIACQPMRVASPRLMSAGLTAKIESYIEREGMGSENKVEMLLRQAGISSRVITLPNSTRTANEAAVAIGCGISEIAKTIVFKCKDSSRCVVVVISGIGKVSESRLAELIGESVERANPEFVRERTGYVIGGVSPIGLPQGVVVYLDRSIFKFEEIWAAAGTTHSVFCCKPKELVSITTGRVVDVDSQKGC